MSSMFIEDKIKINAPLAKVWQALVDPLFTKQYMYDCEVQSDWKIGGSVNWKGAGDGILYVKGFLLEFVPEKVFTYTVIDPTGDYEDIPSNYLTVSCHLYSEGEASVLTVTQGDYATVADGPERYKHATDAGGWSSVLDKIKELVE